MCGEFLARLNIYQTKYLSIPRFHNAVIVTIDGRYGHGGLTDRFRHILSIYSYCKRNGLIFKLLYSYPYDLTEILLPNIYDWRISHSKISQSFWDTKELFLYVDTSKGQTVHEENARILRKLNEEIFDSKWIQFHVYGNACFAEGEFHELFNELFKPSPCFSKKRDEFRSLLPSSYEAVTFRFQNLLGDFKEGDYPELDEFGKEALIHKCITKLSDLYQKHFFESDNILVTSDSRTFLDRCYRLLPFVCVMPGKVVHVDCGTSADLDTHMRSFIDLYMLADADRCVLLRTGRMFESGFPAFAAKIGGKPFIRIDF